MSLKDNLISYLEQNGRITLDQLYSLCGKEHKKTSNAERRFREMMQPTHKSYNPNVKAERNEKGAIVAYVWKEKDITLKTIPGFSPCCYSSYKFGVCSRDCITLIKPKINQLF